MGWWRRWLEKGCGSGRGGMVAFCFVFLRIVGCGLIFCFCWYVVVRLEIGCGVCLCCVVDLFVWVKSGIKCMWIFTTVNQDTLVLIFEKKKTKNLETCHPSAASQHRAYSYICNQIPKITTRRHACRRRSRMSASPRVSLGAAALLQNEMGWCRQAGGACPLRESETK
ncbi:hypothetical protein DM02DRAFT_255337 [Periconia macrospinosa]|uniref:Uncharacterized protein n=1 Tax=Periconia macrospinosa TaxID=97972 RepID=A0A2V1DYQ0_9PLEO|nr:hypothetical protein DM02DRAFT_255337 [Periconia macrospinosa]